MGKNLTVFEKLVQMSDNIDSMQKEIATIKQIIKDMPKSVLDQLLSSRYSQIIDAALEVFNLQREEPINDDRQT